MHGSDRQRRIDFELATREAEAPFRERNAVLRSKLLSIDGRLTELSDTRWNQVIQFTMSVWIHANTTPKSRPQATTRLQGTAELSARQLRRIRQLAVQLGLVRAARVYRGTHRAGDRLEVDVTRVDELVARSRGGDRAGPQVGSSPPAGHQVGRRWAPGGPQVGSSSTDTPRAAAHATEELPIPSSSSSSVGVAVGNRAEEVEEEVDRDLDWLVGVIHRKLPVPMRLNEALDTAIANGCTVKQLWSRCKWFYEHRTNWAMEYRPGALYTGLVNATPGMPDHVGWPYRYRR